jgi:CHAT domain-containing protein
VGEVEDGEGVSGLRRAFRQSGVRTIISSLWPVSDADACAWMEALYRARLLQHATTAQAVRQASLERLRDRRASGAPELPVVWGAFLAAGDWR